MQHGTETWKAFLADGRKLVGATPPYQMAGRLTRINGLVMEASGLKLPLGSGCRINIPGGASVEAEVVGFHGEKIFLMPTDDVFGLAVDRRRHTFYTASFDKRVLRWDCAPS